MIIRKVMNKLTDINKEKKKQKEKGFDPRKTPSELSPVSIPGNNNRILNLERKTN